MQIIDVAYVLMSQRKNEQILFYSINTISFSTYTIF